MFASQGHLRFHAVDAAGLAAAGVHLRVDDAGPHGIDANAVLRLHDELALLVAAGLSPVETLRSATILPARFLNMADAVGSIAEKKAADLVLLDRNPLDDIRHTQRIAAVVAHGRLLSRPALDDMLSAIDAQTNVVVRAPARRR